MMVGTFTLNHYSGYCDEFSSSAVEENILIPFVMEVCGRRRTNMTSKNKNYYCSIICPTLFIFKKIV